MADSVNADFEVGASATVAVVRLRKQTLSSETEDQRTTEYTKLHGFWRLVGVGVLLSLVVVLGYSSIDAFEGEFHYVPIVILAVLLMYFPVFLGHIAICAVLVQIWRPHNRWSAMVGGVLCLAASFALIMLTVGPLRLH